MTRRTLPAPVALLSIAARALRTGVATSLVGVVAAALLATLLPAAAPPLARLLPRAGAEEGDDVAHRLDTRPLGEAVAARVLACYAHEGPLPSAEDRKLLSEVSGELVRGLGIRPSADPKAPECGDDAASLAACVRVVAAMSCDELARRLAGEHLGPPAPWAIAYAGAVGDTVVACYAAEHQGHAPPDDDLARLAELRTRLARSLTQMTSGGACKVDAKGADACAAATRAMPCDALADHITPAADALVQSLARSCERFLDCDVDPDSLDRPSKPQ